MMKKHLLHLIRLLGGFQVARFLTRNDLRILCYHGFAVGDENEYMPSLFMTRETFALRLDAVTNGGYTVITLDAGLRHLERKTLPKHSVVITIDDGFHGTLVHAIPELVRRRFPAALYLTTYHVLNQVPIFSIALGYLVWKTSLDVLDLSGLGLDNLVAPREQLAQIRRVDLQSLIPEVTRYCVTSLSPVERQALLASVAARCGLDFEALQRSRIFHLLTPEEVVRAADAGLSIELHTHRHRSWGVESQAKRELDENRAHIEQIVGTYAEHFCYPSGRYDRYEPSWLQACGVRSATTCVPGFVRPETSPYLLGRFVDDMRVPQIVFEAELAGVLELYRRFRRLVARRDEHFDEDPSEGRPQTLPPAGSLQSAAR